MDQTNQYGSIGRGIGIAMNATPTALGKPDAMTIQVQLRSICPTRIDCSH